ncbi:hypothetical protein ABIB45_003798 [Arthrobacter sp. UYCo732]
MKLSDVVMLTEVAGRGIGPWRKNDQRIAKKGPTSA